MSILSTGSDHGPGGADTSSVTVADRTSAFRKARRHSMLVKSLKVVFPLAVTGLLGIYALLVSANQLIPQRKGDTFDFGTIRPTKGGLAIENPRYEGFNSDGSTFLVTAKRAIPDLKRTSRFELHQIDGTLTQPDKLRTRLVAARGHYDDKKSWLDLYDRIDVVSETGITAQLNSARVFIKKNRIVSNTPVAAQMSAGSIRANAMDLLTKARKATFSKGVAVQIKPKPPAPGKPQEAVSAGLTGNSNAPIDILARVLTIDDAAKIAIFKQGVRATQDGSTLTAQELQVHYEGSTDVKFAGPLERPVAPNPKTAQGTRLKRIKALGNVVIALAEGRRARSDWAEFDAAADTGLLVGNVVLTQAGNVVKGARLALDRKAQTALLTGNVRLRQGRNLLTGGRLFVERARARSRLDSPANGAKRAGRINATFYQNKAGARTGRKSRSNGKAPAKARAAPVRFKTDPNAPIKILAASLDVDDTAKTAVFKGNVRASQGGITIKSAALIATYDGSSGLGLDAAALGGPAQQSTAKAAGGPKQPARLTRIEARKNVVITTADNQSASGDWADFDLKANTAVMGGNVVLRQGSAEIFGEKLFIDMNTGRTRIIPKRGAVSALKTRSGKTAGGRACPPGRTCLRLIPGEFEGQLKQRNSRTKARPGGGWGASTSGNGASTSRRRKGRVQRQPESSASSVIRIQ